MSLEENKELIRKWYEAGNKGKEAGLAAIDKMAASDCIIHSSSGRDYSTEEYKKYIVEFFNAFPDYNQSIEDIFAEGDKVAVRISETGTHTGGFMGIPPTNKKVMGWAIHIFRISGGKIVEGWGRRDTLGFMQQLGLVPRPGQRWR